MVNSYNKHNRSPKDIDVFAGEQLKKRRKELGISQKKLAGCLGVTFQQVQKYEKGLNRIGASRLYDLCDALDVKPSYFFKGINYEHPIENNILQLSEGSNSDEIISFVNLFNTLDDSKKKILLELLKSWSV